MAQTDVMRLRAWVVAAARQSALINLLIDVRQKQNGKSRTRRTKALRILGDKPSLSWTWVWEKIGWRRLTSCGYARE